MPKQLETFEMLRVTRNKIHLSDYNPRRISDSAKKKLKQGIKKHGFVQPIIVNRRTMRVVGGHQRLAAADEIMKSDDYEVNCAMIDVDEKEEVALNVFLNNPAAQGEWDTFALQDIAGMFPDIDFEKDFGFDQSEIELILGDTLKAIETREAAYIDPMKEAKKEAGKAEPQQEMNAEGYRQMKAEQREKEKERQADRHELSDHDYTLTVVFPNNQEKRDFMRKIRKEPKEQYVKSTVLLDIYNHVYDISVFGGT